MSCSSCVIKIEKCLIQMPGIIEASVARSLHSAKVKYNITLIGPRNIVESIENLGFKATIAEDNSNLEKLARSHKKMSRKLRNSFIFSAIFGFSTMAVMFLFMFGLSHSDSKPKHPGNNMTKHSPSHEDMFILIPGLNLETLLLFILCTPVQVKKFYNYSRI